MTGYDAHGNFLPPQQLVDEIERLRLKLGQAEKIAKLLPESAAEIERLRAAINWQELEEYACTGSDKPCGCYNLLEDRRTAVIEECARVAETWYENHHPVHCDEIAAAIRALKDRP